MVIGIFYFTQESFLDINKYKNQYTRNYYIENALEETGAKNIVSAIYMDYRLFDSIFEAGILLITATAIIFMTNKDEKD